MLTLLAYVLMCSLLAVLLFVFTPRLHRTAVFTTATIAVAATLLCGYGVGTLRYLRQLHSPSVDATPLPLQPQQVEATWIKTGESRFSHVPYSTSPASGVGDVGIWRYDGPGSFEWNFGQADEVVYILDGSVDVEYLGERFTLRPGDSATFLANTVATWHVQSHVHKSYAIYHPNWVVRTMRRFITMPDVKWVKPHIPVEGLQAANPAPPMG